MYLDFRPELRTKKMTDKPRAAVSVETVSPVNVATYHMYMYKYTPAVTRPEAEKTMI